MIYMLEAEDDEIVRIDIDGNKEKMVEGSGGHEWEPKEDK